MTTTTTTAKCLRCGRTLTSSKSVARQYGRTCATKVRKAAAVADFTAFKDAAAARAKAEQLIADAAIVPLRIAGQYLATSSDGTATYMVDTVERFCACKGHARVGRCYHMSAADILEATAIRTAA